MPAVRPYPKDRLAGLTRALSSASSSTGDIYLGWSCADLIEDGSWQRLAPTVFLAGRDLIVMRHDAGLGDVPRFDRLIFLTDDDWRAGMADRGVPVNYRLKLALVEARAARRLEPRADIIVVSAPSLRDLYSRLYPDKTVTRINPSWPAAAPFPHRGQADVKRIAYLGARSHGADFAFLRPVLQTLLADRPDIVLTVSGEQPLPPAWRSHDRIEILPPMSWQAYRGWMKGRWFDLGLYPMMPGGLNGARSLNKLLEYDQFGAAVIGSDRWGVAADAAGRGACLLLADYPALWRRMIVTLLDNPAQRAAMAGAARDYIFRHYTSAHQRLAWHALLSG